MEIASANHEKSGPITRGLAWLEIMLGKFKAKVIEVARKTKTVGQEDPRRIIHSLKVGLAITLVSLFYYFEPLYDGFGVSAMWAVLTVVVVFEFTVGATLGRGLNRGLATLLAGALGFGAHHLASLSGEKGEPILLGLFVFLLAAAVTFVRFFPRMKARYDYGLLIFILTFCLISVSGYRDDEVLDMAQRRLSTILIGSAISVLICIFICPVWAGDNLHNLVANNMEKLGSFLEGFASEYFKKSGNGESKEKKTFLLGYKTVLNSKHSEESLANFARWEPPHGPFRFHHPWKHYQKIGSLSRHCAYRIEAINGYLNSEIQTPPEIRSKIEEGCTKMSTECGKALKELASSIKTMTRPSSAETHIANSKTAAKNLKSLLKTGMWEDIDLLEVIPAATIASLLVDVVTCTEKIAESVDELASLAHFKSMDPIISPEQPKLHQETTQPSSSIDKLHHVITIDGSPPDCPGKEHPLAPMTV
ncbi:hypothetical protein L1049_013989 [Liquidambar formosana]|uniref:Aluminum-activated malate transporter 2-like n=1 Tax=Liquidambar formosana TaxID=63359 RepID=A0AAP0WXA3_LIQFO